MQETRRYLSRPRPQSVVVVRRLLHELPAAIKRWQATDPVLADLARRRPPGPRPGRRDSAFATLVESLLHQQVSLAAGRSIVRRVRTACGGRITPQAIVRLSPQRLRAAGVSRQKQSYIRDLARRTRSGALDFRRLASQSDDEVVEALTAVRGIGPWTAKMFLLFHLERPNVVSPEDFGLRLAASRIYRVRLSRTSRFLESRARVWSPYGSLACLTLWQHKDGG